MSNHQDVVVWLDPGLITGLAWWDGETGAFGSWQYEAPDLIDRLYAMVEMYGRRLAVGYEMYIVTGGGGIRGTPQPSLKIIGTLKDMAAAGTFRLLPPVPSSSRKLGSAVLLRRLSWYLPGKPHANDAAQHLLAYLLKQRPMPTHIRHKLFPGYGTGVTIASRTTEVQE